MTHLELLLIRHGETDQNRDFIFRGRYDVRLNATGIAQADATAEALKDNVFEAVYSSPLKRAFVTARRIAMPHGIEARIVDDFIDINYGTWQGRKEEEVKALYPREYAKWSRGVGRMKFRRGESTRKAWKRTISGLREVLFTHGTGCVIIVSHRIPIKMMTAYLLGRKLADIGDVKHDPCAISSFEVRRRDYRAIKLNDSSHLAKLALPPARDF